MKIFRTFFFITFFFASQDVGAQLVMGSTTHRTPPHHGLVWSSFDEGIIRSPDSWFAAVGGAEYTNDTLYLMADDGTMMYKTVMTNYGVLWEPGHPYYEGSFMRSISFNHTPFVGGKSYGDAWAGERSETVWRWDTLSNTLINIRSFSHVRIVSLYDTPERVYCALLIYSASHLGSGTLGTEGSSLVSHNPSGGVYQTVIIAMDHDGNLVDDPVHIFEDSDRFIRCNEIRETGSGDVLVHLVIDSSEVISNEYLLLDGTNIADVDQVPNIINRTGELTQDEVDLTEDPILHHWYLSTIDSEEGTYRARLNSEDWQEYERYNYEHWGVGSHEITVYNGFFVKDGNGTQTVYDTLLFFPKYAKKIYPPPGGAYQKSVTNEFIEFYCAYGLDDWDTVDISFDGVPLAIAYPEDEGYLFLSVDMEEAGQRVHTNPSAPLVLSSFDYVWPSDDDPLLLEPIDAHTAFMRFEDEETYVSIGIENEIPIEWVEIPDEWELLGTPRLLYHEQHEMYYSYVLISNFDFVREYQYLTVFFTTDSIHDGSPPPNNLPTFVGSDVFITTIASGEEFTLYAEDIDGDTVTFFLSEDAPDGLSMVNDTVMKIDFDEEEGYTTELFFTDAIDTVSIPIGVIAEGHAFLSENEVSVMRIFPNPTRGIVYISHSENTAFSLILYDMQGCQRLYTQAPSGNTNLDLQNIEKGVYVIQITNEQGEVCTHKIIKN